MRLTVGSKLIVTLVHGTWPRGFIPGLGHLFRSAPSPYWFEAKSEFRRRMSAELEARNINHEIVHFLWSGNNSLRERETAALKLVAELKRQGEDDPSATRLVIAHSHGGNVTLRALEDLEGEESALVVTLATPFLDLLPARFVQGRKLIGVIELMGILVVLSILGYIQKTLAPNFSPWRVDTVAALAGIGFITGIFFLLKAFLHNVYTNLGLSGSNKRVEPAKNGRLKLCKRDKVPILVLRGVDDEASLSLAVGSVVVLISRMSTFIVAYIWILISIGALLLGTREFFCLLLRAKHRYLDFAYRFRHCPFVVASLLLIATVFKSAFFGREFLFGDAPWHIAVNSVPDGTSNLTVVTLPSPARQRYLMVHSLYEHPDCCDVIGNWLIED